MSHQKALSGLGITRQAVVKFFIREKKRFLLLKRKEADESILFYCMNPAHTVGLFHRISCFRRIVFLSSISAVSFSSLTDLLIFRISLSRKLIFFFISAMEFLRCTVGRKAGFELFLCPTTGLVMFTVIFCLQDSQKSVEERIIRRSCNNLLLKRR